jgi:hypothetical protein
MRKFAVVLSIVSFLAAVFAAVAEEPPATVASEAGSSDAGYAASLGSMVTVKTQGGGSFRGVFFSALADRIEIASPEGVITSIARSSIVSLERVDERKDQAEYFQDSAANRLILMPTAFAMESGEFHVAAQEIIVITASYGISSNWSTWGGASFPGGVLNLRWSTTLAEKSAISLGTLGGYLWLGESGLVLPYAIASFGHENRNLTVGAGLPAAWWPEEGIHFVGAVATIAGKAIVSPTTSIVTENWFMALADDRTWSRLTLYAFPSAVFRIAGERFSWDIGAVLPIIVGQAGGPFVKGIADGYFVPIPILSVTYRIN